MSNAVTLSVTTLSDASFSDRSAALVMATGTLVNAASGLLFAETRTAEGRSITGALENHGTVRVDSNIVLQIFPDAPGFTLADGLLDLTGELRLNGGDFLYQDGAIDGLFRTVNSTLDIESTVSGINTAGDGDLVKTSDRRAGVVHWGQGNVNLGQGPLLRPEDGWMQAGGRQGRHSEHLGHMLAGMQHLQRAHPGARW